jgi:hypothetical protein
MEISGTLPRTQATGEDVEVCGRPLVLDHSERAPNESKGHRMIRYTCDVH